MVAAPNPGSELEVNQVVLAECGEWLRPPRSAVGNQRASFEVRFGCIEPSDKAERGDHAQIPNITSHGFSGLCSNTEPKRLTADKELLRVFTKIENQQLRSSTEDVQVELLGYEGSQTYRSMWVLAQ